MNEVTGKREEGRGNKTTQVYLRWVGVCAGTHFESAQDGPWDVVIDGDVIVVDARDIVELDAERRHLETSCLCSGLRLHMAEVREGSTLGDWRPVTVAAVPSSGAALMEAAPDKRALGRALVEAVDGLHAERSKQVLMARELRTRGEHAEREAVWERVQELTLQIEQSERDLEALGGRAAALAEAEDGEEVGTRADRRAAKKAVRWHAPRYEDWPDVNVDVVVLCQYPELKTPVVKRAFHDCNCWRGSDSSRPLRCEVIGWMTDDEALRLLGKAVRHG